MIKPILLVGPESSGTRIFTELLSKHPRIEGTSNIHETGSDLLDEYWNAQHSGADTDLIEAPSSNCDYFITRRSMPHGMSGKKAEFMDFVDLRAFVKWCRLKTGNDPIVFITARSPYANLKSWQQERASAGKDWANAVEQYWATYLTIFEVLNDMNLFFCILPLEALYSDGEQYLQSIFKLLGIYNFGIDFSGVKNSNPKRYAQ